ncbi:MAG: MFS transporter, partial [Yaniella sp.]|nr:MFS transporter [Yaniella sp.]
YVIRLPHPEWKPDGWDPSKVEATPMQTKLNVSANKALKTPKFWFLWIILFTNVTAGIGILENAAPMIQDYFPGVTAAAAAGFVGILSLANMGGRFIWSTASDYVGRKNIYLLYLGVGALLYLVIAFFGGSSLALFIVSAMLLLSFYGGGFSTIPAYLRDMFGYYQVGAIHGRILTAWAAAGIAGPLIVNSVVESQSAAGNQGPELYTLSMYIMVGLLVLGLIANVLMRPVAKKYTVEYAEQQQEVTTDAYSK